MATGEWRHDYLAVARLFGTTEGNTDDRLAWVVEVVVEPLLSDIRRLSEFRPPSPVLGSLLAPGFPLSGDQRLDELLAQASAKFLDSAPIVRQEGLERLWDSWERLKTLLDGDDKKKSITKLLDQAAAPPSAVRDVLEADADALSKVGNNFEIRHFELNRSPMSESAHVDYLFHRLAALIHLVLDHMSGTGARRSKPVGSPRGGGRLAVGDWNAPA
jgi:hypothetical protein